MNVPYLLITVTKTEAASTLKDLLSVVVIAVILGMGRFARVKNCNNIPLKKPNFDCY
jgi:hypothetical protein